MNQIEFLLAGKENEEVETRAQKKMVEWLVCKDYKRDDIYSLYKKEQDFRAW